MKKNILTILSVFFIIALFAQEKIYIHKTDKNTQGALLTSVDSLNFNTDASSLFLNMGTTKAEYKVAEIDSITFGENSNTISIQYNGNSVSVFNPLAFEGVSVTVNGADVTVNSTIDVKDIQYKLSGTTTEGSFKIYSARSFYLQLNGVNITNTDGPAINIQSKKTANIVLVETSTNTLTDGNAYSAATITDGVPEDQSSTFFSEAPLKFNGTGYLTIFGKSPDKHALASDNIIEIDNGNITIASSAKDGIHSKDGYTMNNGIVAVSASSDGIDGDRGYIKILGGTTNVAISAADAAGISCDSTLTIGGGTINVTTTGTKSKGIKSTQAMTLSGGNIAVNASGGVVLTALGSGFDASYCSAIKSDASVTVSGATISIIHTGISGKGISTGTDFTMTDGVLNIRTDGNGATYTNSLGTLDAYSATCISTNGTLNFLGGAVTASSSGIGGKGFSANGALTVGTATTSPTINASTSGASVIYNANSITEAKVMKSDGNINVVNGIISLNSTGAGECMDSKASINISGGTVIAQGSSVANTKTLDYGTTFAVTGGYLIASGPYRSKTIPTPSTTTSTQSFIYATLSTTTTTLAAATLFNIQGATANSLVTYSPNRAAYYFIFSSPELKKSTPYSIYTGGSSTGTNTNGLYTNGVYTPGVKKTTFTTLATSKTTATFAK